MAQGWHGDSAGHARAGQLGGQKSAESRRARAQEFGERIGKQEKQATAKSGAKAGSRSSTRDNKRATPS